MNKVIGPILLQRQCDGGKDDMTDEQWAEKIALRLQGQPAGFFGCGTWFQWYFGSGCHCPTCGRQFAVTFADIKRFRVLTTLDMMKERELEERVLRNVLARIGQYRS
jgi:hypothetical protein